LLVAHPGERRAEIVDYKTDSAFTWERNLGEYERQMGYYLRAASEILGYRVERATLLFLGARREVEVAG
jgi:ATP-dependent exoDNAse (exonuclease V) beta subunit